MNLKKNTFLEFRLLTLNLVGLALWKSGYIITSWNKRNYLALINYCNFTSAFIITEKLRDYDCYKKHFPPTTKCESRHACIGLSSRIREEAGVTVSGSYERHQPLMRFTAAGPHGAPCRRWITALCRGKQEDVTRWKPAVSPIGTGTLLRKRILCATV